MSFNILTYNGIAVKVNNSYIRECEFYTLTLTTDEHCHVDQTSYYVRKGTVVPLSPSFDQYYILSGYVATGCSVVNGTVTVNQDCSVKINSKINWFTLTVTTDSHSHISPTSYFVEKGSVVTLNPTFDQYYELNSYTKTGDCTISGNKVTVNGNCTVNISSKTEYFTFNVYTDSHSHVTQSSYVVKTGQTFTISPTFDTYYRLNNYTLDKCSISGNTVTVNGPGSITVNSKENLITISGDYIYHVEETSATSTRKGQTGTLLPRLINVPSGMNRTNYSQNVSGYNVISDSSYGVNKFVLNDLRNVTLTSCTLVSAATMNGTEQDTSVQMYLDLYKDSDEFINRTSGYPWIMDNNPATFAFNAKGTVITNQFYIKMEIGVSKGQYKADFRSGGTWTATCLAP